MLGRGLIADKARGCRRHVPSSWRTCPRHLRPKPFCLRQDVVASIDIDFASSRSSTDVGTALKPLGGRTLPLSPHEKPICLRPCAVGCSEVRFSSSSFSMGNGLAMTSLACNHGRVLAATNAKFASTVARLDRPDAFRNATSVGIGVGSFVLFSTGVKAAMHMASLDVFLPPQIGCLFGAFSCLALTSFVAPRAATALHSALVPGVAWVNRWLVVFLTPVQVLLPTICFPGGAVEGLQLAALVGIGWLASLVFAARLVKMCQVMLPAMPQAPSPKQKSVAAPALTPRLPVLWFFLAAFAFPIGVFEASGNDTGDPDLLGVKNSDDLCVPVPMCQSSVSHEVARLARGACAGALGVSAYAFAVQRGVPGQYAFLSGGAAAILGVATIAFLRGESYQTVVRRDYITGDATKPLMDRGVGDHLLSFLGPALAATGVQLFQYRARVVALGPLLLGTCLLASLANVVGTAGIGHLLGVTPELTLAATLRCVTVPIALPTYDVLCAADRGAGNVALVALVCAMTGILGFGFSRIVLSSALCDAPLAQPVVRGIATGASAHALGCATFAAAEPEAFAWGMLSMALSGVCSSALICACSPVRELVIGLAHGFSDS
eukprot:TRINITY_DN28565_c0_g1_i1.p1 TRINITY_DN28565_c0_g1~~TRINITY_DN28565_c0_g1_i1.p1  ORF type:complete len:640 (-),score=86.57 TRINITY_DN28565_c0_g1_i1:84-1904(-)